VRLLPTSIRLGLPYVSTHDGLPLTALGSASPSRLTADRADCRYLIEDLALGIYSSALGWSVVGYDTWPGVPSGPLGYTRPPPLDDTL
jgi:hypothetical protein